VTLEQSDDIANHFFSPEQRFEFGLPSFLGCSLCDLSAITNVDEAIDIFYCLVGFVHSCHLPEVHEVNLPIYPDFLSQLLSAYLQIKDYDPHRFVWLIEAIKDHCHVNSRTFRSLCDQVVQLFADGATNETDMSRVRSVTILSTSPSIHGIAALQNAVNRVFMRIIQSQRIFAHQYLFGGFIACGWTEDAANGEPPDVISLELRVWRLYLTNLIRRIDRLSDVPKTLIAAFLDDSLLFLTMYYGEVQASKAYSLKLRMDLLEIVRIFEQCYPITMRSDTKQKLWYLLFLVAISGCADDDISQVVKTDCQERDEIYLGLAHNDRGFNDYKTALCRLSLKFEEEFELFPTMTQFIRANYGA
jgi:hypothetical protein